MRKIQVAKFNKYRSDDGQEEHIYIFDSNIWTDEPVQAFIDTCKANGGYCNIVKIKYIEE